MADKSAIEWTDATWNPLRGCTRVSEGCRHCYAEGVAARFSGPGLPYEGLAKRVTLSDGRTEARWTGKVVMAPDTVLTQPLRWAKPRRIFVNSMSDLFHESVPDDWIDQVFAVMALASQHTFQILTKRPERMRVYFRADNLMRTIERIKWHVAEFCKSWGGYDCAAEGLWPHLHVPLPNVWLGVSTENQATGDERIPVLLDTPAALRFVSAEPLLGALDLTRIPYGRCREVDMGCGSDAFLNALTGECYCDVCGVFTGREKPSIDWVICGGENGPRPMHPEWARGLRDQCAGRGVPFFFKQWGSFAPRLISEDEFLYPKSANIGELIIDTHDETNEVYVMRRVGKAASGGLIDGVQHHAFPEAR